MACFTVKGIDSVGESIPIDALSPSGDNDVVALAELMHSWQRDQNSVSAEVA